MGFCNSYKWVLKVSEKKYELFYRLLRKTKTAIFITSDRKDRKYGKVDYQIFSLNQDLHKGNSKIMGAAIFMK
jgi:hypothetical protein